MNEFINSQSSGENSPAKRRRRTTPDISSSPAMKAMVCELCGSNEIIKTDGLYQCVYCKTKYTVEEARKLLFDGVVKIDNSEKLDNLYEIARRARDENNIDKAAKYYDLILQEDAKSWEAQFYTVYFSSLQCKIGEIGYVAISIANSSSSVLSLIKMLPSLDLQCIAIQEIVVRILTIVDSLINAAKNHYQEFSSLDGAYSEFKSRFDSCTSCLLSWAAHIDEEYENNPDIAKLSLHLWKQIVTYEVDEFQLYSSRFINSSIDISDIARIKNEGISIYTPYIKKYDPSYTPPQVTAPKPKLTGCYIATAVYGSYNCPEVWTLRRYRDEILSKTYLGRLFIRLYYAISPSIVSLWGTNHIFKSFWRKRLDRMVTKLNNQGLANTPYQDKEW